MEGESCCAVLVDPSWCPLLTCTPHAHTTRIAHCKVLIIICRVGACIVCASAQLVGKKEIHRGDESG